MLHLGFVFVRRELRKLIGTMLGTDEDAAIHWGRGFGFGKSFSAAVVIVLSIHLRILSDPLLPCLATDKCTPHGASNHFAGHYEYRRCQDYPYTPCLMRHEKQDIHQEGQQRNEQGWE